MAAHSGAKIAHKKSTFILDPESKYSSGGDLTYWLYSWSGGHPTTAAGMDTMISTATLVSTGLHDGNLAWGNGSQQYRMPKSGAITGIVAPYPPYMDRESYYAVQYKGWIYAPENGTYSFSCDGDDAMDVKVNGTIVAYWYGGHGFGDTTSRVDGSITLTKGWHSFEARFEEQGGGDGIAVGWKTPSGSWEIIPSANYKPLVSSVSTSRSRGNFIPKFNKGIPQSSKFKLLKGKKLRALEFTPSNVIDLPDSLGYTTKVSCFAWFKSNGSPTGGYHIICGGSHLEISIPTAGALRTGVETSSGRYVSNHGSGVTDGNWHHIGFTYDGSTKRAYIDGSLVGSLSVPGTLVHTFSNRKIGQFGSNTSYYPNGEIGPYHVYKEALSDDEVRNLYEAHAKRYK